MKTGHNLRRARGASGQSLVEFAIALPVLLVMVLGVADLGRAIEYNNILINEQLIKKIQYFDENNIPFALVPTHRSYIDFMLCSYILYSYNIKCPHIIAAEDFLKIMLVHRILRKSGAIFISRAVRYYNRTTAYCIKPF